jgi:hypothetical protein
MIIRMSIRSSRARAPGRPKPGEVPAGDRLRYTADEGLS